MSAVNLEFKQPHRISVSVRQTVQHPSHPRFFNGKLQKLMDLFLTSQTVQKKLLTFHSIFHLPKILLVPSPNGEQQISLWLINNDSFSVDSRVGTDEEPRSTTATGITSIQYRQFTSDSDLQVKVANGEDNVQCMSAKFPDHTTECSDIAEIPKPSIVLCPSTFTPK